MREAFAAGARGFLGKRDAGIELLKAMTDVVSKRNFVSKSLPQPSWGRRQRGCMKLLGWKAESKLG
jgi:DNA-binding NarL/FixJ family response regulator